VSHGGNRTGLLTLAALCLGACATVDVEQTTLAAEQAGLSAEAVRGIEARGWTWTVNRRRLPPDVQLLGVRDLRCKPASRTLGFNFICGYRLEYGRDGATLGTIKLRNRHFGRDADGVWDYEIVV